MFRRRLQPQSEFSLASIADMVFLLLIYFMLTSSFVSQTGVRVELPQGSSMQPSPAPHSITITAKGEWYWDTERISKNDLPRYVRAALAKATDPQKRVITLRTDRTVTMEEVAYAISLIAENRGSVVIATRRP
ncbi:MAG: biopolymer transporter ExbD [Bacteroidia bacterium]|jgi:biopolymer transport protein ExbD|nr:biopolymer transporter ExbD [Bacteroidia bacterium]GIV24168.1 MAG: biopolymer transporter ExbD [Bacteroidia bacterium]